ncbi:hypothetical protein [Fischerella thermalis]|nr:hypothetical protein [Fischerella thermalis]
MKLWYGLATSPGITGHLVANRETARADHTLAFLLAAIAHRTQPNSA